MGSHRAILLVLSAVAGLVVAQDFSVVPTCAQPCYGLMKQEAAKSMGCASDSDTACQCGKPSFWDGLKSCSLQSCSADPTTSEQTLLTYAQALCNNVGAAINTGGAGTQAPTTTPTPTQPAPSQTPPATSAASQTPLSSTTPVAAAPTTTSSQPQNTASTPTSSPSGGSSQSTSSAFSSSTSSSSTGAAAAAGSGSGSSSSDSGEGLSQATKLGIGIGAGAAAVGLIGVAACLILHKRGKRRDSSGVRSLAISEPMPGSGRSYAGDHHTEKYSVGMSDLEFKSRRYEDMLPRQSPRNMV